MRQVADMPAEVRSRITGLDAVRGLAIVLMLLDHALVVAIAVDYSAVGELLRFTVTRASLPLFMISSGVLLGRSVPRVERVAMVALAAVSVSVMLTATDMPILLPEILAVWLLVIAAGKWIVRWPAWTVAVGVVQFSVWPIEWGGYQPGAVAALLAAGAMAGPAAVLWGEKLPRMFAAVGRRPLVWYVGHLAVLCGVWLVVR